MDVGTARVGVARCDPDGLLAVPVETVPRDDNAAGRIAAIALEYDAIELVVGLPVNLRGDRTGSTVDAEEFAARLSHLVSVPVRLVDERLSTVSAQQALHAAGRSTRSSRKVVDQVAAVVLLQHAIDVEKNTGRAPGAVLTPSEENT